MSCLLVIDDDPQVRELVPKLAYAQVGSALRVLQASDLGEAGAICLAAPVGVVLCDYFMPEHDGPEVVRHLRSRFPRLRAVLMTGDSSLVGQSRAEADVPVRDKADLEAVVREAAELALEGL